jgi:hypothetical protein
MWDWEHPDVIRILEKAAERLKFFVLKDNLQIIEQNYDAHKTALLSLIRESKVLNRHGKARYVM